MTKKQGSSFIDDFEGDSIYLAKEVLDYQNMNQITLKSDMFSLGLSILEIIFKIELPKSGLLWTKLRNGEFDFNEIIQNTNINPPKDIILLISYLIHPDLNQRPSTEDALTKLPQLLKRVNELKSNNYKRSLNPIEVFNGNNSSNFVNNSPLRIGFNKKFSFC